MNRASLILLALISTGCPSTSEADGSSGAGGGSATGGGATGGGTTGGGTTGGGTTGGGTGAGTTILTGVQPGAAYRFANTRADRSEVVEGEARAWVISVDGGVQTLERPVRFNAWNTESLSRQGTHFYDYSTQAWNAASGTTTRTPNRNFSYEIIGEPLSVAGLVVLEGDELQIAPFDGSTPRIIASGVARNQVLLLPGDFLVWGNATGVWEVDLKTTNAPVQLTTDALQSFEPWTGEVFATLFLVNTRAVLDLTTTPHRVVPLGFLESPWVNGTQLGRVQWSGNELHAFDSLTSTNDQLVYDSPNPVTNFYVLNGRALAWTEDVDGGSVYRVAELRTTTLQPLTLPREFSQFKFTTTVRVGYLVFQHEALEIDLEHGTLGAALDATSFFNFRRDGVVFVDASTRALTFRPWGGTPQVLASPQCALLSSESQLGLHQCADRQLAYVNAANQRVVVAGRDVADDYYSLDTHRSLVRFFEGDGIAEPGTMWLSDLSANSIALQEREPHFYRYRFGAGTYVHSPGETAGAIALFDPTTRTDFAVLDAGNVSLFPRPDQRDGGAHAVISFPSATGVGRTYRLFDLARRTEVNVGTPDVDAVTNMWTDRFPARVVSAGSVKFLATDGTLVSAPVLSDGGEESSVTDLRLSNDRTHYLGGLGIYDENLAPRVELEGWKVGTRDPSAHLSWVVNQRSLDDGGTEQTLVTLFEDGGVQRSAGPVGIATYGGSDYGFFVGSDSVSGVRVWFPGSDSYVSSATAADWQLLPRGFVSRDLSDAGSSVVLHLLGEPPSALTSPGETALRMITHPATGRVAVRSTTSGWHQVRLSVFDTTTRARKVVFESTTERVGVFQFSADGRQLIFSVAAWDGSRAELRAVQLE